jgi:UDP-N-acetylglucosamine 4,6-dehydratase
MTILITGGTGTFGNAYIKHLLEDYKYDRIIIFSRDEFKQHQMRQQFNDDRLRWFLGDVRDINRLQLAFKGVDVVIHAAALKQVESSEYNPSEVIATNIHGTENVVRAAIDNNVQTCLLISSDKAVEPANLYGATKMVGEKLFVAANRYTKSTFFVVVRYGNVMGSRGSVLEKWNQQIKAGMPITITDPNATRFWMRIDDAIKLIDEILMVPVPGAIYIPKVPAFLLGDLNNEINSEYDIVETGMVQGEKLHETLISKYESDYAIEFESYYMIRKNMQLPYGISGLVYSSDTTKSRLDSKGIWRRLNEMGFGERNHDEYYKNMVDKMKNGVITQWEQ